MWTYRVEAQRGQKALLDSIRDVKELDSIRRNRHKPGHSSQQRDSLKEKKIVENYKYCGRGHPEAVPHIWNKGK